MRVDASGDHEHGTVRSDRAPVMVAKVVGRRGAHDVEIPDRPRAERMTLRVYELAPGALSDGARVLRVLLDLSDGLLADELDLGWCEGRPHDGVGHELEQDIEIAPERLRAERRRVRTDVQPRGRADAVEGVGPRLRVTGRRASQHRERAEPPDARPADRLEPLPRLDRQKDRSGLQAGDRDGRDPQAVLEAMPANVHQDCSGTNQPTVRPFS